MVTKQDDVSPLQVIQLPPPDSQGGMPIYAALSRRCTTRQIVSRQISEQSLSTLLWAACGINRAQGPFGLPGRTAASASNSQEIDIYVAFPDGVYIYRALDHTLALVAAGDLRALALTPGQKGVDAKSPVQFIYVADIQRLAHTKGFDEPGLHDPEVQNSYYYVDTGLIAGNVYLSAAAEGLAAWFHNCDRLGLERSLGLRPEQKVLFAHSLGFPQ